MESQEPARVENRFPIAAARPRARQIGKIPVWPDELSRSAAPSLEETAHHCPRCGAPASSRDGSTALQCCASSGRGDEETPASTRRCRSTSLVLLNESGRRSRSWKPDQGEHRLVRTASETRTTRCSRLSTTNSTRWSTCDELRAGRAAGGTQGDRQGCRTEEGAPQAACRHCAGSAAPVVAEPSQARAPVPQRQPPLTPAPAAAEPEFWEGSRLAQIRQAAEQASAANDAMQRQAAASERSEVRATSRATAEHRRGGRRWTWRPRWP